MAKEFSFKKAWNLLPKSKITECREKIMSALGISAKPTFYARLNGSVEPKLGEARKIEAIFLEYGITDIWGE